MNSAKWLALGVAATAAAAIVAFACWPGLNASPPSQGPASDPQGSQPLPTIAEPAESQAMADVYGLKGKVVRKVGPPFVAGRAELFPGAPDAMMLYWDRGRLKVKMTVEGAPGIAMHMITRQILDCPLDQLEGEDRLRFLVIEGDLVYDPAASFEDRKLAIEKLAWEAAKLRIVLKDIPAEGIGAPPATLHRLKITEVTELLP